MMYMYPNLYSLQLKQFLCDIPRQRRKAMVVNAKENAICSSCWVVYSVCLTSNATVQPIRVDLRQTDVSVASCRDEFLGVDVEGALAGGGS